MAVMFFVGCTKSTDLITPDNHPADVAIAFDSYLQDSRTTRATYPNAPLGEISNERLRESTGGFGVFAQHTGNSQFKYDGAETGGRPYNFMWNQQVTYDGTRWTYSPVKYWPNDNQPADDGDNDTGNNPAQGSQEHSYVSFFAYAPYRSVTTPSAGATPASDDDGIVGMTGNGTNAGASYLHYRTSKDKPFGVNESVDLLWASQHDRYKMDGGGYTTGSVDFVFKHALSKVTVNVKALVDRTTDHASPAYSTDVDGNTKIFIDNVAITTPDIYTEGKLWVAPDATTPTWDYTGLDSKKYTGFAYSTTASTMFDDQVKYSLRYVAPNVPVNASITDTDSDGLDDVTGLTLVETARADFDAMEQGVTATEQQLSAKYDTYMFCPSTDTEALSVTAVYHVVTFDPQLTLNNPKYYSDVTNNITATLDKTDFKFEPNRQYKIVLNLGLTSIKFEISMLDDSGEWILLSAVVKEWDPETREVNVE